MHQLLGKGKLRRHGFVRSFFKGLASPKVALADVMKSQSSIFVAKLRLSGNSQGLPQGYKRLYGHVCCQTCYVASMGKL